MLVDTASQYGVGNIYLLAGWFNLAPIGYGTLGFLSGTLSALAFAAGYCIMRFARTPRTVAAPALLVAVVMIDSISLPDRFDPPGRHPALRLADGSAAGDGRGGAMAADPARRARAGPADRRVSSIWSLEGFAYTSAYVG